MGNFTKAFFSTLLMNLLSNDTNKNDKESVHIDDPLGVDDDYDEEEYEEDDDNEYS